MPDKEEKVRIELDFSEEAYIELDKLQKQLHASCAAEVVRDALGVLRWVTNHLVKGNKIMVDKQGADQPVEARFPFLQAHSNAE